MTQERKPQIRSTSRNEFVEQKLIQADMALKKWQFQVESRDEKKYGYDKVCANLYVDVLQIATLENQENFEYQLLGYKGLGDIYMLRHGYINAIALYNFALGIATDSTKAATFQIESAIQYKDNLQKSLKHAETVFITNATCGHVFLASPNKLDQDHRDFLRSIRDESESMLEQYKSLRVLCKNRIGKVSGESLTDTQIMMSKAQEKLIALSPNRVSIKKIYIHINTNLRHFIRILIEECVNELSDWLESPSCDDYAVICFGSLARNEATTCSDFEFGVLLSDAIDTEKYRKYFRVLTKLLNIKIINLGETTPRMQYISELVDIGLCERYSDSPNKQGFSFDGNNMMGRKTPLGNMHFDDVHDSSKYELILTPLRMATLHNEEWFQKDKNLSTVLISFQKIIGSECLTKKYCVARDSILQKRLPAIFDSSDLRAENTTQLPQTLIVKRSFQWIRESLDKYAYRGDYFCEKGRLIDVKYHLYRLPCMLIDHLVNLFSVVGDSLWDRTEALFSKSGLFPNVEAKNNLIWLINEILYLRLLSKTNINRGGNLIVIAGLRSLPTNSDSLRNRTQITEGHVSRIHAVYISLKSVVNEFYQTRDATLFMKWSLNAIGLPSNGLYCSHSPNNARSEDFFNEYQRELEESDKSEDDDLLEANLKANEKPNPSSLEKLVTRSGAITFFTVPSTSQDNHQKTSENILDSELEIFSSHTILPKI